MRITPPDYSNSTDKAFTPFRPAFTRIAAGELERIVNDAAYSGVTRSPIPQQGDQRFQAKAIANSGHSDH